MNTIICEKPYQAKDITNGLGINFNKSNADGYVEGQGYYITWG